MIKLINLIIFIIVVSVNACVLTNYTDSYFGKRSDYNFGKMSERALSCCGSILISSQFLSMSAQGADSVVNAYVEYMDTSGISRDQICTCLNSITPYYSDSYLSNDKEMYCSASIDTTGQGGNSGFSMVTVWFICGIFCGSLFAYGCFYHR